MVAKRGPAFGDVLRRLRRAASLTQEQLAEQTGLSVRGLSDLERGLKQRPYPGTLRRLADALALGPVDRATLYAAAGQPPSPEAPAPNDSTAAARSASAADRPVRSQLPIALTSFVGREVELAEVTRLLGTTRLLTLTGSGGCGKSRLALRVATDLVNAYVDGVWLVELASLNDPQLIAQAVGGALGAPESPSEPMAAVLRRFLKAKQLLLVLDNCEHLLAGCAALADELLRACPKLTILATSREPLRVGGEITWRVPSLPVPPAEIELAHAQVAASDAVRLFVERASAVQPGFVLTAENDAAIAQICRRLDGIPLAIELAAGRVRLFTPGNIVARLDERFRLLVGGSRVGLPRYQTLRASIAWSHDLLAEPERVLFRRLAVFAGSFSLEAAEAVCGEGLGDVPDLLSRLVNRSLVQADHSHGDIRYRLLETLREYAREQLVVRGEAESTECRHAETYLALAEAAEPELQRRDQANWLDRLDLEQNNLRAAQNWLGAHDRDVDALRLAVALGRFWVVRGYYSEGRSRLAESLDRVGTSATATLRAAAYRGLGRLAQRQGDTLAIENFGQAFLSAAAEAGHSPFLVKARIFIAEMMREVEPNAAGAALREALALARELGLVAEAGRILVNLGGVTAYLGDATSALTLLAEGLADMRDSGDQWYLATGLNFACTIATHFGDYRQVGVLAEEYRLIVQTLKDRSGQANYCMHRAAAAWWEGDRDTTEILLTQALKIYEDADDRYGVAWAMVELSRAYLARGDLAPAQVLADEGLARARAIGANLLVHAVWAAGEAALTRGEVSVATSLFRQGLVTPASRWMRIWCADLIDGLAKVAATQNLPRRALCLAGAAAADRARLGATASPIDREWLDASLAPARQALGEALSSLAYATGQSMSLEQAIAYAREDDGG
jgi:non-specific serine/threonine protein kinase